MLVDLALLNGRSRDDVVRNAGAVEAGSEHPIAKAIVAAATAEIGSLPRVEGFRNLPGVGVRGRVEGTEVEVARTNGAITVSIDSIPAATLTVRDTVKPTSALAIAELKRLGLTPVLLTGDAEETARRVAAEVGIESVIAEVMPAEKAAEIRRLQAEGEVVAMVGDGVNDVPALAQADLGLAIGTGTDAAIEASDLTLVSGDLRAAADGIRLASRTLRTIKGNLFWAFAYNVARDPARRGRPAQPHPRRRRDGLHVRVRRHELTAASPLLGRCFLITIRPDEWCVGRWLGNRPRDARRMHGWAVAFLGEAPAKQPLSTRPRHRPPAQWPDPTGCVNSRLSPPSCGIPVRDMRGMK